MIKYRGKTSLTDEDMNGIAVPHQNGWVYGYYVDGYIVGNIIESTEDYIAHEWWCRIIPETVGREIGLKDKNGRMIYKGDILKYTSIIYTDCSRTEIAEIQEPVLISIINYHPLAPVIKPRGPGVKCWAWCQDTGAGLLLGLNSEELEVVGNMWDNPELRGSYKE